MKKPGEAGGRAPGFLDHFCIGVLNHIFELALNMWQGSCHLPLATQKGGRPIHTLNHRRSIVATCGDLMSKSQRTAHT
jgi:hypothetical protein